MDVDWNENQPWGKRNPKTSDNLKHFCIGDLKTSQVTQNHLGQWLTSNKRNNLKTDTGKINQTLPHGVKIRELS